MTPFIKSVEIWKDDEIPTHKIFQMTLGTTCEQKQSKYLRSLPLLKSKVDAKVEKQSEGKEPKEKHEERKKEFRKMHCEMDQRFEKKGNKLKEL